MPDAVNTWFKILLMAMFKQSLSAPASQSSLEDLQQHLPPSHGQTRQALLGSIFANVPYDTYDHPVSPLPCRHAATNDTHNDDDTGARHRRVLPTRLTLQVCG